MLRTRQQLGQLVDLKRAERWAPPQLAEGGVRDDSPQPRLEEIDFARGGLFAADRPDRLEERILDSVAGVGLAPEQAVGDVVGSLLVDGEQPAERLLIPGQRGGGERSFIGRRWI